MTFKYLNIYGLINNSEFCCFWLWSLSSPYSERNVLSTEAEVFHISNFTTEFYVFNCERAVQQGLIWSFCHILSVTKVEILLLNVHQPIRAQFETN